MRPNPIRKVASRSSWSTDMQGRTRFERVWVADCPACGERVRCASYDRGYVRSSRKRAKDALHRHMLAKHHS